VSPMTVAPAAVTRAGADMATVIAALAVALDRAIMGGGSAEAIARRADVSGTMIGRIRNGHTPNLSIGSACRIASIIGQRLVLAPRYADEPLATVSDPELLRRLALVAALHPTAGAVCPSCHVPVPCPTALAVAGDAEGAAR
jgi:transcriptional regulator with XRE-family HTH domain